MSEDNGLISLLTDAAWDYLDQEYLNNGEPYVDALSGIVDGNVDMPGLVRAILEALRLEEGE